MFEFDKKLCTGCGACVTACLDMTDSAVPHRRLSREEDAGRIYHVVSSCLHCEEPACAAVCPTGAIKRDGFVTADPELCVSCGACAAACPFGGIPGDSAVQKCGGCRERVLLGYEPVCVEACPVGAVRWKNPQP